MAVNVTLVLAWHEWEWRLLPYNVKKNQISQLLFCPTFICFVRFNKLKMKLTKTHGTSITNNTDDIYLYIYLEITCHLGSRSLLILNKFKSRNKKQLSQNVLKGVKFSSVSLSKTYLSVVILIIFNTDWIKSSTHNIWHQNNNSARWLVKKRSGEWHSPVLKYPNNTDIFEQQQIFLNHITSSSNYFLALCLLVLTQNTCVLLSALIHSNSSNWT